MGKGWRRQFKTLEERKKEKAEAAAKAAAEAEAAAKAVAEAEAAAKAAAEAETASIQSVVDVESNTDSAAIEPVAAEPVSAEPVVVETAVPCGSTAAHDGSEAHSSATSQVSDASESSHDAIEI